MLVRGSGITSPFVPDEGGYLLPRSDAIRNLTFYLYLPRAF